MSAFVSVMAIFEIVKTKLDPKRIQIILQSLSHANTNHFINDVATIIKSIPIDIHTERLIVELSQAQDTEDNDQLLHGTGDLGEQGIHQQTIISDWRQAAKVAREVLEQFATIHEDQTKFREDLVRVASTTLISTVLAFGTHTQRCNELRAAHSDIRQ